MIWPQEECWRYSSSSWAPCSLRPRQPRWLIQGQSISSASYLGCQISSLTLPSTWKVLALKKYVKFCFALHHVKGTFYPHTLDLHLSQVVCILSSWGNALKGRGFREGEWLGVHSFCSGQCAWTVRLDDSKHDSLSGKTCVMWFYDLKYESIYKLSNSV